MKSKMKPKLCIDIDNVIADTDVVVRQVIREYTGNQVRLERDDIIEFDYFRCLDVDGHCIDRDDWNAVHHLFAEPRYLMQIQPLPGAIQGLHQLAKCATLHIATSRLPKARKATIEWLEHWCVPAHDLHFVKHKEKHASLGAFLAAVEDHYEQAVEFAKRNTECLLIDHPWNASKEKIEHISWVESWPELTERLLTLIKSS